MNYKQALDNKIFDIASKAATTLNLECYVIGGFEIISKILLSNACL